MQIMPKEMAPVEGTFRQIIKIKLEIKHFKWRCQYCQYKNNQQKSEKIIEHYLKSCSETVFECWSQFVVFCCFHFFKYLIKSVFVHLCIKCKPGFFHRIN